MIDQYFSRAATWLNMNGRVVVHDSFSSRAPRMITMEPWHELVFMAADGVHTVNELIENLGAQYEGGVPAGLAAQVESLVADLVKEGILELHESGRPLPVYFAEEYAAAPPEVRKAQMQADGRIS